MMTNYAPIVLFVYNRPWHTKQTIEALQNNDLSNESDLYIYSDAPKNDDISQSVKEVREYLKSITGFKSITIIERETNWGLAANIIDGVTEIINRYGRAIIVEDDLITSTTFLDYMNQALDVYENEKSVWHIAGWNPPIGSDHTEETFLWRGMHCWGWATWADRWQHYDKDTQRLIREFSDDDIYTFNLENAEDFWSHLLANHNGTINTWAIYWYTTIFQHHGLCLSPSVSFVENIGHDGSGVHCGTQDILQRDHLNSSKSFHFTTHIIESASALKQIQHYYRSRKKPLPLRAINKLSRFISGKNLIR